MNEDDVDDVRASSCLTTFTALDQTVLLLLLEKKRY